MGEHKGQVRLVGGLPLTLYGLPLEEWQARAWARAGLPDGGTVIADRNWVVSTAVMGALVNTPGAALVERTASGERRLVAAHARDEAELSVAKAQLANVEVDEEALLAAGYRVDDANGLAGRYNHMLRKREAPYALDLLSCPQGVVEKRLFASAYKGVTDFVTKYAWPLPARAVTKWCAERRISPNAVTTASLVLTLLAFWFFWEGQWAAGLVAGWGMTFLDTVDGKLARTTMTSSNWGNAFDHGIDLIHPPFWYWAWYHGITGGGPAPEWLTLSLWIVLGGYVLGRLIEGAFMQQHGFHIHVWRPADSFMREITARRNPNMFLFMVLTLFGAPALGFAAVAIWTVVCTLFHAVRLLEAMGRQQTSWLEAT